MFGKKYRLMKIFDFEINIDLSWIFIALLISWGLAIGYFPTILPHRGPITYWIMGVAGAVMLFFSIIIHEISHSLVARRNGLAMKGITLFIFGGVAEMTDEPQSPKSEFTMAIAGPIVSVIIGLSLYVVFKVFYYKLYSPLLAVIYYLSFINIVLAIFNMIPAFPLDGGRILRSILWAWKKDIKWATRISSRIGSGFAIALIALGIMNVIFANFIGGMWWALIGMFLYGIANRSYKQLVMREALIGETVTKFMNPNPVTITPYITVEDLVLKYIYKFHFKIFPVVDGSDLLGVVTFSDVKKTPREKWANTRIKEIMSNINENNSVTPETSIADALAIMSRNQTGRLIVQKDNNLFGIMTLKDMLKFMSIKIELEREQPYRI